MVALFSLFLVFVLFLLSFHNLGRVIYLLFGIFDCSGKLKEKFISHLHFEERWVECCISYPKSVKKTFILMHPGYMVACFTILHFCFYQIF